jgi:hypothetical protein
MKNGLVRFYPVVALIVCTILGCSSAGEKVTGGIGGPEIVEGGVVFNYQNTEAKRVYLVGDFNYWSPRSDPMKDPNGDGNWALFFPLAPGTYSYKFVVDGRWMHDPHNPLDEPDGFGGRNSLVRVPAPGAN